MSITVYHHRDFDGICSAAVFASFIRKTYPPTTILSFIGVDYESKRGWAKTNLRKPSAIVDFLYHPDAEWWFDHHETTFVRKDWELQYRGDAQHRWRTDYKSCPNLVIDSVSDLGIRQQLRDQFLDAAHWCDVIDSAGYNSPQQVVDCVEPALQINATLVHDTSPEYLNFLIDKLEQLPLARVANLEEVAVRFKKMRVWQDKAIEYIRNTAVLSKGVATIDFTKRSELFHRYAVYYLWPDLAFQVALYRRESSYRLTVTANPWRDSNGPHIGAVCEQYGGGGRDSVGGVITKSYERAIKAAIEIARILRNEMSFYEQLSLRRNDVEPRISSKSE